MDLHRSDIAEIQEQLLKWFQKILPEAESLSISNMRKPETGWSNETYLFTLVRKKEGRLRSEDMVLRRPPLMPLFPEDSIEKQVRVMECLQGSKIPVPKVYWHEKDEKVMGAPFYVMEAIDGVTPADVPSYFSAGIFFESTPQQRSKIWWNCVETIAEVHLLDWKKLGLSFLCDPSKLNDPLVHILDEYGRNLDWARGEDSYPIHEATLKWLRDNRYVPEHVTLCWGDSRMSNIIYTHDFERKSVLDWETACLGDHETDLAWLLFLDWCNSEYSDIPRLEGTPGREETIRRYEELAGWKVKNLFYNEVLAAFLLSLPMLMLFKNLETIGVSMEDNNSKNNFCTQRMAALLGLTLPE